MKTGLICKTFTIILVSVFIWAFTSQSNAQVTFENVQPEIGEEFQFYPNFAAWGDIDNDGDLDVYMNVGAKVGNDLMINDLNQSGKFLKADTLGAHFIRTAGPRGVVMADLENDGDLDILVINDLIQVYLLVNMLVETDSLWFEDNSEETGIAHSEEAYYNASFADFNNDGMLDIFLAGLAQDGWTPTLLLKNIGSESDPLVYEDVAEPAGIFSMLGMNIVSGAWGDYDNDGDVDVVTGTTSTFPVFLYQNNSDGTFTELAEQAGLGESVGSCRGTVWADYDNDGDLDLYIARAKYDELPGMDTSELWRNDNGIFHEVESARLPGRVFRGVGWGDYDNDGDLDLYLAEEGRDDVLFRNDGNDTFVDVASTIGLTQYDSPDGWGTLDIMNRGGQTWADWDGDGDLDVLLPSQSGNKPYLMQNNGGNDNTWLEVKLTGVVSNRSAAGTRVFAVTGDLRQMREISIGAGYLSSPPLDCHFGFGTATMVDSLIVKWPSGVLDVLTDITVNQILSIKEGENTTRVAQESSALPAEFSLHQNYPNPFNPTTTLQYGLSSDSNVSLTIFNTRSEEILSLIESEKQSAGIHTVVWNGKDRAGYSVASGIYFYQLKVGDFTVIRKMALMK
jgi:hypothetical protein